MVKHNKYKSNLKVNEGIPQPPSVNIESVVQFKKQRQKKLHAEDYIKGILSGNRTLLSQAITLVESSLISHHALANQIIEKCLPYSGNSLRIGITGVPGVGKSTFIEALGLYITGLGHKLAVLAIDPSSTRSKGSILGDKTRMEELSGHPDAYIRPSPSAGTLGGVARKTRETIILCEAAGFDVVFIETVGVGQSEIAVHSMVDFFLLLMLAGAGDELQGIKRGIMEMADVIAITKADGANVEKANQAKAEYQHALHLFPKPESGWYPKVLTCSAYKNEGIDSIWKAIIDYKHTTTENGFFKKRRIKQAGYWMHETIMDQVKSHFYNNPSIKEQLHYFEKRVMEGDISSFNAAQQLLDEYFRRK
jgi:LAO/AO transport system kinase